MTNSSAASASNAPAEICSGSFTRLAAGARPGDLGDAGNEKIDFTF